MRDWRSKIAVVVTVVIGAGMIGVMAQMPSELFVATFDAGLDADTAAGDGTAATANAELRYVSTRVPEQRAAVMDAGSTLTYATEGNVSPIRGAISFGVQPLGPIDDDQNHVYFALGDKDQPNSITVWKTQMYNDLRFRIASPDGENRDCIVTDVSSWIPGQWYHIIAAWDTEKGWMRLYVDGSQRAFRPGQPTTLTLPERFAVGSDLNGNEPANAVIDDLRITDAPPPGRQPAVWHERFLRNEPSSTLKEWPRTMRSTSLALVPEPDFTFVVISDPHISRKDQLGRYSHNHRVRELVEQMNEMQPAFVLDAGDIVTTFPGREDYDACAEASLEIFKALEVPVYHTAGNHDVGNKLQITYSGAPGPDDVYKNGWFVNEDNLKLYRDWFGPDWYSFDYDECHFVVLNNALMNSGLPDEKKQTDWLKADLEAAKDSQLTFVAVHNPLFWVGTDDVGTENYELVNEPMRGELIDLFDEYDVAAVFTGHTHHRISNYLRGTKYLTLPSTTFARNFGGSYGLPGLKVVWDPERVGYYVVRVYGKESRINLVRTYAPLPPLETLQEGNESPRMRAIGLKSAEIEADDFGVLSAPPPKVDRSIWNTMGAVDGVKPSDCKPELVPAHCWTSNVHAFDDQHDWLTVTLPAAKQIDRVIYYPRPGNFGWPLDFTISISADGETWETVVKRENFKAPADATETGIEFSLEGTRSVMAVKMDMLRISATDHTNIRTAMMEVVLPDGQGGDCALEALGAVAASGTKVGGDRKTVDDHFFAEPTQAGAKWAVLPGDTLSRETVELAKGKLVLPAHVRRAFTLGRPPGLRFVIPITRAGPLHATSSADEAMEAFRDYVAFMGRECPKGSAWRFVIPEGHVPVPPVDDAIAAALIDLRRADSAASIVLELADASMAQDWATGRFGKAWAKACDGLMVPVTAGGRPETELAEVLNGLGDEPALPVWLTLDGWKSAEFDDITRAKLLARSMVWARAEGIGLIWWAAPGEPGGLLNSVATPEATMYAYRSVATLLSGAEPLDLKEIGTIAGETDKVEARAFRAVDGSRLVALWQPAEPGATAEPATIRIRPTGQAGTPVAVDCLTCTLQELNVEGQGGQSTIEGLQIRDWPIIVRMDG